MRLIYIRPARALSASIWRRLGSRSAAATREAHALPDSQTGEHEPVEEAKGHARLRHMAEAAAVAVGDAHDDSHGNAAGEPEEGRESEQAKGYNLDVQQKDHRGCDGNVEEDEDGPNSGE